MIELEKIYHINVAMLLIFDRETKTIKNKTCYYKYLI